MTARYNCDRCGVRADPAASGTVNVTCARGVQGDGKEVLQFYSDFHLCEVCVVAVTEWNKLLDDGSIERNGEKHLRDLILKKWVPK